MNDNKKSLKSWFNNWQGQLKDVNAFTKQEEQSTPISITIQILEDAFQQALKTCPGKTTSGLVDMQAIFMQKTTR
jgi:hypothetical protein